MFEVGEYIVFATNGVCKVEAVGKLDMNGVSEEKLYYTLTPVYAAETKVFTPVDNDRVLMRPVLSKEEAWALINDINNIEAISVADDKSREEIFKEAIKKCDCRELVKIIKTLYYKKQTRLSEGKKMASCDDRYFKMAEGNLYEELALALEIDKSEVESVIAQRVEALNSAAKIDE